MREQEQDGGRVRIASPPEAVLATLPAMGRVMVTGSAGDVTHERIGPVERVGAEGGDILIDGASHRARLDIAAVGMLVADRTGRMKDRALPRIQVLGRDGRALCAMIALDGLEPFDAALAGLSTAEPAPPLPKPPDRGEPPDPADDATRILLDRLAERASSVEIAFASEGLTQSWSGKAPPAKLAMGFVNVIHPDLHLHVRSGAIASWREECRTHIALAADGTPVGLIVRQIDG